MGFDLPAQTKILFVGNSLTYTNDLPALLVKLGEQDGVMIKTEMIAFPNYALEDHWNESNVSNALKNTKFDYVIFQQGPSAMPESRVNLIEYALKFSTLFHGTKTKMCMYTVWPSVQRSFDFANVIKSYSIAADTTTAIALQAGLAWQKILEENKDFPLYAADGFHPSRYGSFLAALVIYASLFQKTDLEFVKIQNMSSADIRQRELELMKRVTLSVVRQ